jgi:hypothetical protein
MHTGDVRPTTDSDTQLYRRRFTVVHDGQRLQLITCLANNCKLRVGVQTNAAAAAAAAAAAHDREDCDRRRCRYGARRPDCNRCPSRETIDELADLRFDGGPVGCVEHCVVDGGARLNVDGDDVKSARDRGRSGEDADTVEAH